MPARTRAWQAGGPLYGGRGRALRPAGLMQCGRCNNPLSRRGCVQNHPVEPGPSRTDYAYGQPRTVEIDSQIIVNGHRSRGGGQLADVLQGLPAAGANPHISHGFWERRFPLAGVSSWGGFGLDAVGRGPHSAWKPG